MRCTGLCGVVCWTNQSTRNRNNLQLYGSPTLQYLHIYILWIYLHMLCITKNITVANGDRLQTCQIIWPVLTVHFVGKRHSCFVQIWSICVLSVSLSKTTKPFISFHLVIFIYKFGSKILFVASTINERSEIPYILQKPLNCSSCFAIHNYNNRFLTIIYN